MSWEILTVHAESDSRNTPRSKYTCRYIWLSLRKHSGNVKELLQNSKHNNLKPEQEAPIWVDSVATMSLQSIYQILMGVKEKFQNLLHECNLKWSRGPTWLLQFLTFVQLLFCFLISPPLLQMCIWGALCDVLLGELIFFYLQWSHHTVLFANV